MASVIEKDTVVSPPRGSSPRGSASRIKDQALRPRADDVAGDPVPTDERLSANWGVIGWLVILHGGALAAPFLFSWEGVATMLILHWFTGGIGICLGFHRLLTHTSFKTYPSVRYLIALIGGLAGEGSALDWVASHRKHHALSDQEGDPHSPRDGKWWSHILWLAHSIYGRNQESFIRRWAPDLAKDRGMQRVSFWAMPGHFVFGLLIAGLGYWWGGVYMMASMVAWGVFARLVFVLHSTWLVNSASHIWGYRNYTTTDDSRNNWWVALLTYGEGWHNNHHAYPRMANHGHRWWEFDATFRTIRLMQRLGLAWDVVDYKQRSQA